MDADRYLKKLYRVFDRMRYSLVLSKLHGLSPRVRTALRFIEENFDSGIHLSDAARHVRMHPDSLSRRVRHELEEHDLYLTIPDYINLLKAVRARELLTSQPLLLWKEIADVVGTNPRQLERIFRMHFGSTPTQFREDRSEP